MKEAAAREPCPWPRRAQGLREGNGRRGGAEGPADGRSPQTPGQSSANWDFPEEIQ